jgi:hypothetical protein
MKNPQNSFEPNKRIGLLHSCCIYGFGKIPILFSDKLLPFVTERLTWAYISKQCET